MAIVNKFLFYDNLIKEYKPLPIEKREYKQEIDPANYLDEYYLTNYDAQFFYGYKGWYKDVINEFKNRKELSDDELNAVGRAYSIYAGGLVSNMSGDIPPGEIWSLPLRINCLTPEQIKEFNFLEVKAQEYFMKLADRNPDYETIVGKIGMKSANEVMYQYQILLAYADDYASKMKLPANLYSKEQLEQANTILTSCPAGAILISFGDNDYYPIHYLQHAKGIRRDVYLVNYNLIGIDRYIFRVTHPQYEAKAVKLSVDTSFYTGRKNEIVYVKDSVHSFTFSGISDLLKSNTRDEYRRITLAADKILLSKNKEMNTSGIITEKTAVVSLNKAKYLFKNQWILLDIIENLDGRKICFPYSFTDELTGLNEHLSRKDDLWFFDN